jgi:hypothetical protein
MLSLSHRPLPPRRSFLRRAPRRRTRLKENMTVCVAAICENGRKIVAATDWRLAFGGVASDASAGKMLWFGDWLFMYAGAPAQTNLIFEELRFKETLTRDSINDKVLEAYRKAKSKFCAHAVLSQYDLTMEEFRNDGLRMFGADLFKELSEAIDRQAAYFNEHLLIAGFGNAANAAHLFQVGIETSSPTLSAAAAIGSGAEVALSVLVNLKHARHSTLGDTLYAVAAAKFAAEMTEDDSVGQRTSMYVAWLRREGDAPEKPPGVFLMEEEVQMLRIIWEEHGRPKIPDAAAPPLWEIVKRVKNTRPGIAVPMDVGDMRLSFAANAYVQKQMNETTRQSDSQTLGDQRSPCDEECPRTDQNAPGD